MENKMLKIALQLTHEQLLLAILVSGEKYVASQEKGHDSLAMFQVGMHVIQGNEETHTLLQPVEVRLLLDLAEEVYQANSTEMLTSEDKEFRATSSIKNVIVDFETKYPEVKELELSDFPVTLDPVSLTSIIAAVYNEAEVNSTEIKNMLEYINSNAEIFEIPECEACTKYKGFLIKILEKALAGVEKNDVPISEY
jgi:hypothetical protein